MIGPAMVVHLRINDAATQQPTPVRIRIVDAVDTPYFPLSRSPDFPLGRNEAVGGVLRRGAERWFYCDGTCEIRLPTGVPLEIEVAKGPEYRPLCETVVLGTGQMALRFQLERWSNRRAEGWVCGDTRVHFLDLATAWLEAAAEDLDFVELLALETRVPSIDGHMYATVPNLLAFSGQQPAFSREGRHVTVNSTNVHPALGTLSLLNTHRVVYPLTFGGDDDTDDWALADWCDQCHRKNGLVIWSHPFKPDRALQGGGEALIDALLGKVDALEADGLERGVPLLPSWYRLLNVGVRLPIVGCSGKDSNRVAVGQVRTWAWLGPNVAPSYSAWIEALRAGRTVASNGPLLQLRVADQAPGARLQFAETSVRLPVVAEAVSVLPFERLDLVVNGEVVGQAGPSQPPSGGIYRAHLDVELPLTQTSWIAARCWDSHPHEGTGRVAFAHSSPIWVQVADTPMARRRGAVPLLRQAVEQVREWVEQVGRFGQPKRKADLLELCEAALRKLDTTPTPPGGAEPV